MFQRFLQASHRGVRPAQDRGSVVLETAIAIPALFIVGLLLLSTFAVAATSVALGDTARESARAFARGDSHQQVQALAIALSPKAEMTIVEQADRIVVNVRQVIELPGLMGRSITVDRQAVAAKEDW
jgi:Flp pilus assembly protein TadG